jgi:hypothetical protein
MKIRDQIAQQIEANAAFALLYVRNAAGTAPPKPDRVAAIRARNAALRAAAMARAPAQPDRVAAIRARNAALRAAAMAAGAAR